MRFSRASFPISSSTCLPNGEDGWAEVSDIYPICLPCYTFLSSSPWEKKTTKKRLLLEGRKGLSWSLLTPFTPLEGVWSGCACPLLLLCLSTAVLRLDLFLFACIPFAGCLCTWGWCTHTRPLFSVYPRQQPCSWSLFSFSALSVNY